MTTCAVDPGRSGGIALVSPTELLEVKPLPYRHNMLDVFALKAILNSWKFDQIVLEEVSTHFAASCSASFSFGQSFGEVYAMLRLQTVPLILVRPKVWQADTMGANPKKTPPKERALKLATHLWPKQDWLVGRQSKPHDGMVDSAILAYWGELKRIQQEIANPPDYSKA